MVKNLLTFYYCTKISYFIQRKFSRNILLVDDLFIMSIEFWLWFLSADIISTYISSVFKFYAVFFLLKRGKIEATLLKDVHNKSKKRW